MCVNLKSLFLDIGYLSIRKRMHFTESVPVDDYGKLVANEDCNKFNQSSNVNYDYIIQEHKS